MIIKKTTPQGIEFIEVSNLRAKVILKKLREDNMRKDIKYSFFHEKKQHYVASLLGLLIISLIFLYSFYG